MPDSQGADVCKTAWSTSLLKCRLLTKLLSPILLSFYSVMSLRNFSKQLIFLITLFPHLPFCLSLYFLLLLWFVILDQMTFSLTLLSKWSLLSIAFKPKIFNFTIEHILSQVSPQCPVFLDPCPINPSVEDAWKCNQLLCVEGPFYTGHDTRYCIVDAMMNENRALALQKLKICGKN